MRVCIFSSLFNHKTAMAYGFGRFVDMLRFALDSASIDYLFTSDVADISSCDIVHYHDPSDIEVAKVASKENVRLILHFHAPFPRSIYPYIVDYADELVFVSNFQKKVYRSDRGKIIYNAVVPTEKNELERDYDFIFTARDDPVKNASWVEMNIRGNSKYNVLTTGSAWVSGAERLEYVDFDELNKLYARSKIHLLPSTNEPFGLATFYAMLQGAVPAISIFSGVSEVVPDELSIKFDPYNVSLNDIYDEYIGRGLDRIRDNLREFVLKHDYIWYGEQLKQLYDEVSAYE